MMPDHNFTMVFGIPGEKTAQVRVRVRVRVEGGKGV